MTSDSRCWQVINGLAGGDPSCRQVLQERFKWLTATMDFEGHNILVTGALTDPDMLLDLTLLYAPLLQRILTLQIEHLERRGFEVRLDECIDLCRDLATKFMEIARKSRATITFPSFTKTAMTNAFRDWLRTNRSIRPTLALDNQRLPIMNDPVLQEEDIGLYVKRRFRRLTARQAEAVALYADGVPGSAASALLGIKIRAYRALVERARSILRDECAEGHRADLSSLLLFRPEQ